MCEERFVNYKVPVSISKYFYFKTSSITSSRYLRCTVRCPVSSPDSNAAAGGISRGTSLLLQAEEVKPQKAGQPQRDMTWEWAGVSALWGCPVADGSQCTSVLGCSSSGGTRVRCGPHTWAQVPWQTRALVAPEGTGKPPSSLCSLARLAFPPPSVLLAFPIEASTLQPLPQALLS